MKFPDRTVFVVGAGASVPFDFPTGNTLLNEVYALTRNRRPEDPICRATGLDRGTLAHWGRRLLDSSARSVDEFCRDNPAFATTAKVLIAQHLLTLETDEAVCPSGTRYRSLFPDAKDWLQLLIQVVLHDTGGKPRRTNIITFNFDRIVERRLHLGIQARFGMSEKDAASALRPVRILHMSGSLGLLSWQTDTDDSRYVPWGGANLGGDILSRAAGEITFVHEPRADEIKYEAAQLLVGADLVCFLGFGFHPDNVHAILPTKFGNTAPHFIATGYGLFEAEARHIENEYSWGPSGLEVSEGISCYEFLRRHPRMNGFDMPLETSPGYWPRY